MYLKIAILLIIIASGLMACNVSDGGKPPVPTSSLHADMIPIPAGEFTMGSSRDRDEQPIHAVYLGDYAIDKYEVTNAQYRFCVEAGECNAPTSCHWGEPTYNDNDKANHPVVCVNWEMAKQYCEWRGARLPSEAEWEKAARGTDERVYPWGNEWDITCLNSPQNGGNDTYERTAPVGSFPNGASPYGVLDMAGNVWEWVADGYDAHYYSKSPHENPLNNSSGNHVLRGGTWGPNNNFAHVSNRDNFMSDSTYYNAGVRCAR